MIRIPSLPQLHTVDLSDVTAEQWSALARKRVFFAHQSVGGNIADGIADVLKGNPSIPIRLVETTGGQPDAAPGLYHAKLGRNGAPQTKSDAFSEVVNAASPDVGVLKYCYVDVDVSSNPDELFARYVSAIDALRQRHRGLTIVHVTMPLTTIEGREDRRDWLKAKVLFRPTQEDQNKRLNVIRNRYNALMLQRYAGREPIFDLAAIESTRPDGSRAFFTAQQDTVYYMAPENTKDGGHLNEAARRKAASAFLALLATT